MKKITLNNRMVFLTAILVSIILHGLIYGSCRLLEKRGLSFLGVSVSPAPETMMEIGMIEVSPARSAPRPPRPEEDRLQKDKTEILAVPDRSRIKIPEPVKGEQEPDPEPVVDAPIPGRSGSAVRSVGPGRVEYWDRIRRRIEKVMFYPRRARLARLEGGKVKVGFIIGPEGRVIRSRVIMASSHSVFNRAALEIIKRAAPFPPPPGDIGRSELTIPITFESTL